MQFKSLRNWPSATLFFWATAISHSAVIHLSPTESVNQYNVGLEDKTPKEQLSSQSNAHFGDYQLIGACRYNVGIHVYT